MSKKKEKTIEKQDLIEVLENAQINVTIDYKRIAEEIVLAEKKLQKEKECTEKKRTRFRLCISFVINSMIYLGIAALSLVLIIAGWIGWARGQVNGPLLIMILLSMAFIMIIIFGIGGFTESLKDDGESSDKYMNSNVAVLALIIAVISLFISR